MKKPVKTQIIIEGEMIFSGYSHDYVSHLEQEIYILRNLLREKSRPISVKEKLPSLGEIVVAWTKDKSYLLMFRVENIELPDGVDWMWFNSNTGLLPDEVTHWLPIPGVNHE